MPNKIVDFLSDNGQKLMLMGFGIIAVSVFFSMKAVQTTGVKNPIVWWYIGLGAVFYLVGRTGIALRRSRSARHSKSNEVYFEKQDDQTSGADERDNTPETRSK
jgi:hypothetical protein